MKHLKSILVLALAITTFSSCKEDEETLAPVTSVTVENLAAPQIGNTGRSPVSGEFAKFSFAEGKQVSGDNWDIAFRGTTILANGGSQVGLTDEPTRTGNAGILVQEDFFASITSVPANATFAQDASETYALPIGSGNGWYTYDFVNNVINPIASVVLVVRTHDNKYAKVEILSYYKDQDSTNPENGRFYTFNFVYNPNEGETDLE
jgi:hypothetical protein